MSCGQYEYGSSGSSHPIINVELPNLAIEPNNSSSTQQMVGKCKATEEKRKRKSIIVDEEIVEIRSCRGNLVVRPQKVLEAPKAAFSSHTGSSSHPSKLPSKTSQAWSIDPDPGEGDSEPEANPIK